MGEAVSRGLAVLAKLGADVVLMDPQYVPALLTPESVKQAGERMVGLIASAADHAGYPVNVFGRYEMMRRWRDVEHISFDRIVDPKDGDRLHHSDWSARRMAEALADTIVAAATGPTS